MKTVVEIDGIDFLINGRKTYAGRKDGRRRIEGLLLNSRMIQAIFDDECPATRRAWLYPDTGVWDPDETPTSFAPCFQSIGLWPPCRDSWHARRRVNLTPDHSTMST